MKQFVKKKVSFVMVMIMAVITVISMSLPMAVFAPYFSDISDFFGRFR